MASRRMIDPDIWQSESMAQLTIRQRLLFIGLFSNADDQGRLRGNPGLVHHMVFPLDEIAWSEIKIDLEAIQAVGSILRYTIDGTEYIQLTGWWDYQFPQWAYPSKIPPPPEWTDRLRYRKDNHIITVNWDGAKTLPEALPDPLPEETPERIPEALPKALPKAMGKPIVLELDSESEVELEIDPKELAGKPARAPAKSTPARDDNLKITKHPEMKAVARELAIAYGATKRKPPEYFRTPQQLDLYLNAYHVLGREWDSLVKKGLALGRISLDDLLAFLQGCVKNKNNGNGRNPPTAAPPHQPADYRIEDDDEDEEAEPNPPPPPTPGEKAWHNFLDFNPDFPTHIAKELEQMPAELCGDCLVVHAGARAEWCKERVGKSLERYIAGVPGIAGVEWRQS